MRDFRKIVYTSALLILMGVGQIVAPVGGDAAAKSPSLSQLSEEIATIAEAAMPAVVQIVSTSKRTERYVDPFDFFNRRRYYERQIPQRGLGAGFIIDSKGYILTNNHVVNGSDEIKVHLSDGREFEANLVGADPESEVAVIKIDAKNLPHIDLGDSGALKVGNLVITIGSPQGLEQTVTFGIVSALHRADVGITNDADFIQTDAAINPGNSGGPLLGIDGKVVGIITAIFSTSGGSQGLGFAIPIDKARRIAEAIQKDGKYERGYLGISMNDVTPESAEYLGLDANRGAVVLQVVPDGPCKDLLQIHDAIIEVNGKPLKDSLDLKNRVSDLRPGETVNLTVIRDGKRKTVKVELGVRPGSDELLTVFEEGYKRKSEDGGEDGAESFDLGFSVRELTDSDSGRLAFTNPQGLLITDVDATSEAYSKGLRPNMLIVEVNRHQVDSFNDLRQALKVERRKKIVMLRVRTTSGYTTVFLSRK